MGDLNLQRFVNLLNAFREISGLEVVWKTGVGMVVDMSLPEHLRNHLHPCCVAAKGHDREKQQNCLYNDYNLISAKVREGDTPFLHRCHAGLTELVVPLMEKERCIGVIQCGPFLLEDEPPREGLRRLGRSQIESLMLLIPQLFEECAARTYPIVPIDTYQVRDSRIWELQEYIELNYARPIRLEELAQRCFLSRSRLMHLFKQQCNTSFNEYLQKVRIREARKFLLGTNWSLGKIALRCGFCSQSHFCRVFRRQVGMPPLTFRRSHSQIRAV